MTTYCGVDFHARQQLVKWCNTEDGEIRERQLWPQSKDEVLAFYAQFDGRVIVGFESSGYSSWFETMLEQLGHEVWIARQLLVRTYIMLRDEIDYAEFVRRGVAVRSARVSYRPQVPGKLIERLASEQPLS